MSEHEDLEQGGLPKPEESKPVELPDQDLEKVAGGALNAYLTFHGTKQGANKGEAEKT